MFVPDQDWKRSGDGGSPFIELTDEENELLEESREAHKEEVFNHYVENVGRIVEFAEAQGEEELIDFFKFFYGLDGLKELVIRDLIQTQRLSPYRTNRDLKDYLTECDFYELASFAGIGRLA